MKLIHLSDLHFGKQVCGWSMQEEQEHICGEILKIVDAEQPDAVLIAGDLYDRHIPPEWAVALLDRFLTQLAEQTEHVLLISGNHDSDVRVAFGTELLQKSGVHVAPVWQRGSVQPVTLHDAYGPVQIYLLPYVTRFQVQHAFADLPQAPEIHTYTDALRAAIQDMHVNTEFRNILVAHQFVTHAKQAGSEEIVGALDDVNSDVFEGFDYVALGHLHGAQRVDRETIRYCGSPLKYALAEVKKEKSVTVVELGEKGSAPVIREVPLHPKNDMVELKGSFAELMRPEVCLQHAEDYVFIMLTDKDPIPGAVAQLRGKYSHCMYVRYESSTSGIPQAVEKHDPQKEPLALLQDFFLARNGHGMNPEQLAFAQDRMQRIWEGAE